MAASRPRAVFALILGTQLVLLAGQPAFLGEAIFLSGATLRGVCLALLTAVSLYLAWTRPGPRPALGWARTLLLLAPLGLFLLSLPALGGTASDAARHGGLWLLLALLPFGYLGTWDDLEDAARTLTGLVAAGTLAALVTLLSALDGTPAAGPFGRPGVAGPVLAALGGAAWLLPPRTLATIGGRLARWAPFVLLAAACLATRSRTGVVAFVLGTLVTLAAGAPRAQVRKRLRLLLPVVVALGAVLFGLMVEDVVPMPGERKTVDVRLGLQRASLAAVGEQPLTGHGAGSYGVVALRHRDVEEARLEPGRRSRHAHMDTLHVAVEGGIPAALLFVLYLAGLAWVAARGSAQADGLARRTRAAALGAIVALGVAGLAEGVLIDPAPVLVLALAAATALVPRSGAARPANRLVAQALPLLGGLLALGCCYVLAADAMSERALVKYRHAIAGGVTPQQADKAAARYLEQGALIWRADAPEALYRLGVHDASMSRFAAARDTFRKAFRADPGMTEARLDLAQVYELEGRRDDARAVLEEARRNDPTRYDVPRRLMELAMGPETVPGDAPSPMDEIEVLRWMNLAGSLAPDRFENLIDQARFERRRATDKAGLARAGAWLRQATRAAPGGPDQPPAEILLESFRLAEAEGKASPLFHSAILISALQQNPRPARRIGAEAARFLDLGDEREDAALERAGGIPDNVQMSAAERAYDAAAVRMTALLYAGQESPEGMLGLARLDRDAGRFRRALARYRSLLAWTLPPQDAEGVDEMRGPKQLEEIAREGDLLLEASKVAHRVDRPLANFFRSRGQLRIGFELLLKNRLEDAGRKFRQVLEGDPDQAEARYGLARVLARTGALDEAEGELIAALRLKPGLRAPALAEADIEPLRDRPQVRLRLGLD